MLILFYRDFIVVYPRDYREGKIAGCQILRAAVCSKRRKPDLVKDLCQIKTIRFVHLK